ncbi:MAG: DNA replication/repair protein RecF [Atopobiaceae bacterium]
MGLKVSSLSMHTFRNFSERELALDPGMTVLVGRNATGKTNSIEALQMLTSGLSFRHPRAQDLIQEGTTTARISAELTGDGRMLDVACSITPHRRSFERNGKKCKPADLSAILMSVLFCPDDLSLVKGSARFRREELDAFGAQANAGYRRLSQAFSHAVEQRNRLLKEPQPDLDLLNAWDASVATGGAALLDARLKLFSRIKTHINAIYSQVSGTDGIDCAYLSTLADPEEDISQLSRSELADRFATRLQATRAYDLRRQQTSTGPQRDDITFTLNNRDARSFGSQGQQRSIVLAWKMAEVEIAEEVLGDKPLLLLDDVMSELDSVRRAAITKFVQDGIQTVVTTTNLEYFPRPLLENAQVIPYETQ